jgi:hypothetical protein
MSALENINADLLSTMSMVKEINSLLRIRGSNSSIFFYFSICLKIIKLRVFKKTAKNKLLEEAL